MSHDKQKVYLKIKIKSLAEEAIIIRNEERKWKKRGLDAKRNQKQEKSDKFYDTFWGLREHREGIVREENRAASIAYAYIRGKSYEQIEKNLGPNNKAVYYGKYRNRFSYGQHISRSDVLFLRAARLVQKYGPQLTQPRIETRVVPQSLDSNGQPRTFKNATFTPAFEDVYKDIITWRNQHPQSFLMFKKTVPVLVSLNPTTQS